MRISHLTTATTGAAIISSGICAPLANIQDAQTDLAAADVTSAESDGAQLPPPADLPSTERPSASIPDGKGIGFRSFRS